MGDIIRIPTDPSSTAASGRSLVEREQILRLELMALASELQRAVRDNQAAEVRAVKAETALRELIGTRSEVDMRLSVMEKERNEWRDKYQNAEVSQSVAALPLMELNRSPINDLRHRNHIGMLQSEVSRLRLELQRYFSPARMFGMVVIGVIAGLFTGAAVSYVYGDARVQQAEKLADTLAKQLERLLIEVGKQR